MEVWRSNGTDPEVVWLEGGSGTGARRGGSRARRGGAAGRGTSAAGGAGGGGNGA